MKKDLKLASVLSCFGLESEDLSIEAFGSGLINNTWKINAAGKDYILQKVNESVFRRPEDIAWNISQISTYLRQHQPSYLFVTPLPLLSGEELLKAEDGYYRLFPFVSGSHSIDVVESPEQAYEAARQFGRFTALLSGMDASTLKITILSFHDLSLRYQQFIRILQTGNQQRQQSCKALVKKMQGWSGIVERYNQICADPQFRLRVTHHDTKISNVLFDEQDKGICVIDMDTVMPGYFISDLGDMMRTYLSPVSEEEADGSRIEVREDYYQALVNGYRSEMQNELTPAETKSFFYAGEYMIYMQALRFLSDYLNNDQYYGARYEEHNLVRAANQVRLLECLQEKKTVLEQLVR